jgi:hypothetical protein
MWHGVWEQGKCCTIHICIPWCLHLAQPKLWSRDPLLVGGEGLFESGLFLVKG